MNWMNRTLGRKITTLIGCTAALIFLTLFLVTQIWQKKMALDRMAAAQHHVASTMKLAMEAAAKAGVTAMIQPGGSVKDADVIATCDRYNMAMVMTGVRHFRH